LFIYCVRELGNTSVGATHALTRSEAESMTEGNNEAGLQRRSPHEYL